MESAAKRRYRALPLIASPLKHENQHKYDGRSNRRPSIVIFNGHETESPGFREREEASSIELFFDLFFVANLTSFTTIHPIDDKQTILSYIGFFAILWFTWFQVVLFDVRFGMDSLFERLAKLIHFGVMTTFAIIGTRFDPSRHSGKHVTMRQMSIVLLVSRVVLTCQYGSVLFLAKNKNAGNRRIVTPLAIHIVALATGGILCLGFFFTFTPGSSGQAYIVWYPLIGVEALVVFFASSHWPAVSFRCTNLNERCGLLTLIILGEGIIVLTKSMNYLVQGENFSGSMVAQIISAVLIIFFVYMLYFDQQQLYHSSSHSQRPPTTLHHIWALAHFPFHTALVLLMEGTSRFLTWRNALEIVDHILTRYSDIWSDAIMGMDGRVGGGVERAAGGGMSSSNTTANLATQLSTFSHEILDSVHADAGKYAIVDNYLKEVRWQGDPNSEQVDEAAFSVVLVLVNSVFKFFKIQAAQQNLDGGKGDGAAGGYDPYTDLGDVLVVYDLVFVYFFVAAGGTLVMMAILMGLQRWRKRGGGDKGSWKNAFSKGDWATMGLRAFGGVGLALVATVKADAWKEERFLYSPWMVPTVMLGIGAVVLGDGAFGWVFPKEEEDGEGRKEMDGDWNGVVGREEDVERRGRRGSEEDGKEEGKHGV